MGMDDTLKQHNPRRLVCSKVLTVKYCSVWPRIVEASHYYDDIHRIQVFASVDSGDKFTQIIFCPLSSARPEESCCACARVEITPILPASVRQEAKDMSFES